MSYITNKIGQVCSIPRGSKSVSEYQFVRLNIYIYIQQKIYLYISMSIFILIVVFGSLIIYAKFGSKSGWRPSFFKRVKFTDIYIYIYIYIYSFGDWPMSVLIHFVPLTWKFLMRTYTSFFLLFL